MSGRHRRDRRIPPHLQDQVEAAEAEVKRTMSTAARGMRVPVSTHHANDGSDPILDAMLKQIRTAAQDDELQHCPHDGSPQPMFLEWWRKPWTVRCSPCNGLAARPSELEENTCANCGHVDSKGTWPIYAALGSVMVSLGRCDDCAPRGNRPKSGRS